MTLKRLILLLVLPALAACSGLAGEPRIVATLPPSATEPAASDLGADAEIAAVMTLGGEVWSENCARCHGAMGGGTEEGAPLPDLSDRSDAQILAAITNGLRTGDGKEMPAFGETLNDEQLNAAMTYARMMSRAIAQGMVGSEPEPDAPVSTAEVGPLVAGVVTGAISNGTAGSTIPTGQQVILHSIDSAGNDETMETTANADGTFRFEGVPFDPAREYAVTAEYGSATFVSAILPVDPTGGELSLPITLYESGAEAGAVVIDAMTAQIAVQDNVMEVTQIFSFSNTSDRVFFSADAEGATGTSISIHVPQGATLAGSFSASYRISDDSSIVYETRPLIPGQPRIMHLTYQMPYTNTASVIQPLDFALEGEVDVIVVNSTLTLASESLPEREPMSFNGTTMATYGGTLSLPAGSNLSYRIDGEAVSLSSSAESAPAAGANPLAYILIGTGVAALALAGVLTLRERLAKRR
ncbi:MAG: c-type cytochrome [Anaerolineae bacterium]|nr:c-type cytochrome [Anaerolineae bacterium]NUQ06748.1 c-type cytochrome [Anaerolineae bacterium]